MTESAITPDALREFLDQRGISLAQFARGAGVQRQTVQRYLDKGAEGAHQRTVERLSQFVSWYRQQLEPDAKQFIEAYTIEAERHVLVDRAGHLRLAWMAAPNGDVELKLNGRRYVLKVVEALDVSELRFVEAAPGGQF